MTERTSKGFSIPKRFIVVAMASLATAIQYTIRSNLSVTIVAMVNNSIPEPDEFESQQPIVGCPLPDHPLNLTSRVTPVEYKGTKLPYNESTQGFVLGAFFYGYILTHLFGGQISIIFGAKITIFYSVLFSAIFTVLTPFSTNYDAFYVITLRVFTGMAQGVMSPAIYTLFNNWIPTSERSRAFSFFTIGGFVGMVITILVSGYLCEYGNFFDLLEGWPLVFYFFAILALMAAAIWWHFVYDFPSEHPNITDQEIIYIFNDLDVLKEVGGQNAASTYTPDVEKNEKLKENENQSMQKAPPKLSSSIPWLKLLTSKDVWVVAITKFCVSWCNFLIMSKLPSYLDRILHMSLQKNSMINALIYVILCVSAFVFGSLGDLTINRGWMSKLASRQLFESIACFGSGIALMIIPLVGCNENAICVLMILSAIFYGSIAAGDNVIVCDLTSNYSGSIYGITNAVGSLPGFLCPVFVGFLLNLDESIASWDTIFISSGLIACFGGFVFLLFASVDPIVGLDNHTEYLKSKLSIKSIRNSSA